MNKKTIAIIIVIIAFLILTIFNVRKIIITGIQEQGVPERVPLVIRESYLKAIIALTDDKTIADHFSIFEKTDDPELTKQYPLLKETNICIYDGKDYDELMKKIIKEEAYLYLSKDMYAKHKDVVNEYTVIYQIKNVNNNRYQDLYRSVEELSEKEQEKYAQKYVLNEYNTIGYSLKLVRLKFWLLHILYEVLYIFFAFIAILKIKK